MIRPHHLIIVLFILLVGIPAAAATLVLADVSFTPNAPLMPGSQQQVVARYAVIPSGIASFAKNHELQMQTGLSTAKWSTQITLDGRNAALQSASGTAMFVNGQILSYSQNRDVGMIVTIDGTVPQDATGTVMLLRIDEIDNSGSIVPGSTLTISQQVAGPAPVPTTVPTLTPVVVIPQTTAPRAPGFEGAIGIAACCLAALAIIRRE